VSGGQVLAGEKAGKQAVSGLLGGGGGGQR
jgi:hypothetical protein